MVRCTVCLLMNHQTFCHDKFVEPHPVQQKKNSSNRCALHWLSLTRTRKEMLGSFCENSDHPLASAAFFFRSQQLISQLIAVQRIVHPGSGVPFELTYSFCSEATQNWALHVRFGNMLMHTIPECETRGGTLECYRNGFLCWFGTTTISWEIRLAHGQLKTTKR